ncbi:MAG: hypothetical protein CL693_18260 [Cellvibrionaceae bacterium]|nr:hypothetical protein [Cellvibrionaceae bacterium]
MAAASRSMADAKRMVAGTDINKQTLGKLESGVTMEDYRCLLKNAKVISGNPAILLDAGAKAPTSSHGPLGNAISSSPDRMAILNLLVRFVKSRATFFTVCVEQLADTIRCRIETDDALGEQKDDALDFFLGTLMGSLMSRGLLPMSSPQIQLTRPRSAQHEYYQRILGSQIRYDQPHDCIIFDAQELKLPLPGYDSSQFELAIRKCQSLYPDHLQTHSIREAVEHVFDMSPGMLWSVKQVAAGLATSSRTLQRRLQKEGTSYQQVLDHWLQKQADQYLIADSLSVEATATLLGYGDEANFRRAFKRWFGHSPQVHRQKSSTTLSSGALL